MSGMRTTTDPDSGNAPHQQADGRDAPMGSEDSVPQGSERHPGPDEEVVRAGGGEGPRMRAEAWNLVSAGGSRRYLKQEDLIPGAPVVTINRAIDIIDQGIHVDFAAIADPPSKVVPLLGLERYLVPPIQVWVPRPMLFRDSQGQLVFQEICVQWEMFLPASVGVRLMPFGQLKGLDGKNRHMFCTMAALERIGSFRPKIIRLLCADMMGSWADGLDEEECEKQQQGTSLTPFRRWQHERHHIRKFSQTAAGLQIRVEIVQPKKAILA